MESAGNSTIQTLDTSTSSQFDSTPHIFDGTPQDTTGYSSIHTMINATQPGILRVRHSADASKWDITDTYNYLLADVNTGMFKAIPVKSTYFAVQFENTANVTSDIRLQTLLVNGTGSGLGGVGDEGDEGDATDKIWESDTVQAEQLITDKSAHVYIVNATNFAPDYRYLKLYNKTGIGPIDPLTDLPRITIPLPAGIPQNIQLGSKGLSFPNGIRVRITRQFRADDQNISMSGDVGVTVMYEE